MEQGFFPQCDSSDWCEKRMPEAARFDRCFAPFQFRKLGPGRVEVDIPTPAESANAHGGIHGGYLAARIEQILYLPLYVNRSVGLGRVVIVDYSLKYLMGGELGESLQGEVELMQETGRLGFTRGLLRQGDQPLVSFTATIRKLPPQ